MSEPTSGQYREFFRQVGLGHVTADYITEVIGNAKERSLVILKQKLFDRVVKRSASLGQLRIFRYLIKTNQFDKAREFISDDEDLFSKSLVLIELAEATQNKKDIEAARKNFADITVNDRISELVVSARIELFAKMAKLTKDRAYLDKALSIIKESDKDTLKDRDGRIALIALMESLFELGMVEEVRKIGSQFGLDCAVASITKTEKDIDKARKVVMSKTGISIFGFSIEDEVRKMLGIAQVSKNKDDIDCALDLITVESGDERERLYVEVITVLSEFGDIERARELTDRICKVYTGLYPYFAAWVAIARISKDKRDITKVKGIFKERFHDHFVSQNERANALVDIAELTGNRQDINRALEAIEEMPVHDSLDETRIASLQLSILEIL
ncbi:MAG: hypothetical protein WC242_01075 [Candidatus Paceibacterota bacterium]|jgi:tetratricopeptide (TPR) repeat protein